MGDPLKVLIALGKNWGSRNPLILSLESQLTAYAAGLLWQKHGLDYIIFTGGQTAGKDNPSEAKAMKDFTKMYFPNIPDERIIIEGEAVDTADNAVKVINIFKNRDWFNKSTNYLLTVGPHIKRAQRFFNNFGLNIFNTIYSDSVALEYSETLKKQVHEWYYSPRYKKLVTEETILRLIQRFDRKGKILRKVTHLIRR